MKKIRFLYILVTALFLSCQDDTINHDDLQSDVQSAKDFFINEIENFTQPFSARVEKSRKSVDKSLLWEKAYYKSTSFGQVIIVPLKFAQPLYLPKGDQSLSLDQLSYAMFHKNETGYELFWITALPNQEFQNNNEGLDSFTGTVFIEDWYGNFIQGFRYSDEGVEDIQRSTNGRMNGECEVVAVFYCSQVCDNNGCGDITCEWSHDEVTCPDDGGGMPPSDNPGDFPPDENGTGGSGDGPDGDDFPVVPLEEVGDKPIKEYEDKCAGITDMWNSYPNNEVAGYLTADGKVILTNINSFSGGSTFGIYIWNGIAYYPSSEKPDNDYYGMIVTKNKPSFYLIPIVASMHTHTPCRSDSTNGVSHPVGPEDMAMATTYQQINHCVIGCDAIAQFSSTNESFYNIQTGELSSICQNIN